MKILIVSATEKELTPLFNFLKIKPGNHITSCSYKKLQLDILVTGIGMVATAYQMGKCFAVKNYDYSLNIGIAGCFDKNYTIGEPFNIIQDNFSELGAEDGDRFLSLNEINLIKNDTFFINQSTEIVNNSNTNNSTINSLKQAKGITVNTIHGNEKSINKIRKTFNPVTESMEGAAFMNICLIEKIPFAQIRCISNYVDERSKANWNINLAIDNLNQTIIKILNDF